MRVFGNKQIKSNVDKYFRGENQIQFFLAPTDLVPAARLVKDIFLRKKIKNAHQADIRVEEAFAVLRALNEQTESGREVSRRQRKRDESRKNLQPVNNSGFQSCSRNVSVVDVLAESLKTKDVELLSAALAELYDDSERAGKFPTKLLCMAVDLAAEANRVDLCTQALVILQRHGKKVEL